MRSYLDLLVLTIVLLSPAAYGDSYKSPLEKIENSDTFMKLQFEASSANMKHQALLKKSGTNYATVFSTDKAKSPILKWLGDGDVEFTGESEYQRVQSEYAIATKRFFPEGIKDESPRPGKNTDYYFDVTVLVPKPNYIDAVKFGLIPAFAELIPPRLSIKSSKKIVINGFSARFFVHREKGCSIHVPLTKGAVINFYTPYCSLADKLTKLAESLNISRLNTKLHT